MRISSVTLLGVVMWLTTSAGAQDAAPPPGFTPAAEYESSIDVSRSSSDNIRDEIVSPRISRPDLDYLTPRKRRALRPYPHSRNPIFGVDPNRLDGSILAPFPHLWLSAESLAWWSKASPIPVPLVTDGGALGTGSSVVLGNQNLALPVGGGGRFTLGAGLGSDQTWAMEGTYFFVRNSGAFQVVGSDGSPGSSLLSFPFYNPNTPGEDSSPIALPGAYAGTAVVSSRSLIQGVDVNVLHNQTSDGFLRFDLLGGFRYVNLQEIMTFRTDSPNVFPNPHAFFHTFDAFDTHNNFYGGQIGGRASIDNGFLFFNASGKLALGETVESVAINGGTFTNVGGGFESAQGGYLAQPTNIGTQSHNRFSVVPEVNLNFGVYLAPWARLTVGYSFLYISSVARPGDQIDRVINPTQSSAITGNFPAFLAGTARPAPSIHNTDFWAQGVNIGLELRF